MARITETVVGSRVQGPGLTGADVGDPVNEAVVEVLRHGASITPNEGRLRRLPTPAVRATLESLANQRLVLRLAHGRYRMAARSSRGLL